ncbi:MAG: RdgB/HAM1 family non-canonical purine NTP pyrophosphatase [Evtepia sp.]
MKMVLASQNKKKLVELQKILSDLNIEVVRQENGGIEVEETGTTFEENAALKAEAVCKATGMAAIADDSGLVTEALEGAPGIFSARYGSAEYNDTDRWKLLLEHMKGKTNRSAQFVCVICCVLPDGGKIYARGTCDGLIAEEAQGSGGFGYDPIFYLPQIGKTMAQLSETEKNQISHRANALKIFKEKWETQYGSYK